MTATLPPETQPSETQPSESLPPETTAPTGWTVVCRYADLQPERGVAALIGDQQVALFRLFDGSLHAVGHRDPVSGAHVIARGIVGTRGDAPTVASPMYKQVFDLRTGICLDAPDDPAVRLPVHPVRVQDGVVEVQAGGAEPVAP